MTEKEFIKFLQENNIKFEQEMLIKLKKYQEILQEYNKKFNLTAIVDTEEVYLKHFCDSLLVATFINFENYSEVVDIGTGAGFPGLVLKIFFPNLKLYLIESNGKKCQFLNVVCVELNLKNVTIINDRAENFALNNLDKFEIVISRAVASLKVLAELCLPLLRSNGLFIAMKGKEGDEISESENIINKLKGELVKVEKYKLPVLNHDRLLIIIKKIDLTPKGYPRNYQEIVKKHWKRIKNKISL